MARKTPIRHMVSGHTRGGKRVSSYSRGKGSRPQKPKRTVGKVGIDWSKIDWSKAESINTTESKWDIVDEAHEAFGWRPSEKMVEYTDTDDIIYEIQSELKRRGYKPKRMTEAEIRDYTTGGEPWKSANLIPYDYWVWWNGKKAIVMIHDTDYVYE